MQRTAGNDRDQTHSQVWRYSAVGYVQPLGNCRNPREGRWIQHPKSCFFRPKNLSRAIQLLKNWTPTTSNMGLSENTVPIKITIGWLSYSLLKQPFGGLYSIFRQTHLEIRVNWLKIGRTKEFWPTIRRKAQSVPQNVPSGGSQGATLFQPKAVQCYHCGKWPPVIVHIANTSSHGPLSSMIYLCF